MTFAPLTVGLAILLVGESPLLAQRGTPPRILDQAQDGKERPGSATGLRAVVSVKMSDATIADILNALARQAKMRLVYSNNSPVFSKRTSVNVTNFNVMAAFKAVLGGTGFVAALAPDGETIVVSREAGSSDSTRAVDSTQGTVRGQVTDARTQQPVPQVQVTLVGAPYGVFTDNAGSFVFPRVAPGTHKISVRSLGHATTTQTVVVSADKTTTIQIELRAIPQHLREVVTTGAGDRQRLEVGNSTTRIDADSIVRTTPLRDISDLIKSRAPGTQVLSSGGTAGAGSRIRIRGIAGLLTNSDPIVIIDGVRVDATYSQRTGESPNGMTNFSMAANQLNANAPATSRLNDIDPEMIETVEVLKGPSAATLYGSDAANGVIVIKTKRGRPGPARWGFATTQKMTTMNASFPDAWMAWGSSVRWSAPANCVLNDVANDLCTQDSLTRYNPLNSSESTPFGTGYAGNYTTQLSGGTPQIRYFLGGSYGHEMGLLKMPASEASRLRTLRDGAPLPDWVKRPNQLTNAGVNLNLASEINDKTDVTVTGLFHTQYHRDADQGAGGFVSQSYVSMGYRDAVGAGWGQDGPALSFLRRNSDATKRTSGGIQGNFRPMEALTVNGLLGMDLTNRTDETLLRAEDIAPLVATNPSLRSGRGRSEQQLLARTGNLSAAMTLPITPELRSRSTTGMQYQRQDNTGMVVSVENLESGSDILNGGTIAPGSPRETRNASATVGWFMDQSFALREQLFVTAALRGDAGSAFGRQARAMLYPKFNSSWLISQESFFPKTDIISNMRLRAAFGQAGVQPGTEARFRSYRTAQGYPAGVVVNGFQVATLGNTHLVPERSMEFEGGFDLSLWNDRLTVDGTTYLKQTRNALVLIPLPSSFGFISRQENIGEVKNQGTELSMTARPVLSSAIDWSVTLGYSRNTNTLVKLGTRMVGTSTPTQTRYVEGYPVNGFWARPILAYADENEDGILSLDEIQIGDSARYVGSPTPKSELSLHNSVGLFSGRITIATGFNYQGGLTQLNGAMSAQCSAGRCQRAVDRSMSLAQQAIALSFMTSGMSNPYASFERVSWLRWNDLSITVLGTPAMARMLRSQTVSMSFMGRNLGVWSKYRGADPEVNTANYGNSMSDVGAVPQTRDWSIRVNLNY